MFKFVYVPGPVFDRIVRAILSLDFKAATNETDLARVEWYGFYRVDFDDDGLAECYQPIGTRTIFYAV